MAAIAEVRSCLRVLTPMISQTKVNKQKLIDGFSPDVFATDRALELVGEGMPFRDAYHYVKENLHELDNMDPCEAIKMKTHLGAPMGLDWEFMENRAVSIREFAEAQRATFYKAVSELLGTEYPLGE